MFSFNFNKIYEKFNTGTCDNDFDMSLNKKKETTAETATSYGLKYKWVVLIKFVILILFTVIIMLKNKKTIKDTLNIQNESSLFNITRIVFTLLTFFIGFLSLISTFDVFGSITDNEHYFHMIFLVLYIYIIFLGIIINIVHSNDFSNNIIKIFKLFYFDKNSFIMIFIYIVLILTTLIDILNRQNKYDSKLLDNVAYKKNETPKHHKERQLIFLDTGLNYVLFLISIYSSSIIISKISFSSKLNDIKNKILN